MAGLLDTCLIINGEVLMLDILPIDIFVIYGGAMNVFCLTAFELLRPQVYRRR